MSASDRPRRTESRSGTRTRPGFYGSFQGGWNLTRDHDFATGLGQVDTSLSDGYALGASIGYDFGPVWRHGGVRVEAEYAYRRNSVDGHRMGGSADLPGSRGRVASNTGMFNVMHDFHTGTPFTPYLGAGIGYSRVEFDDYGIGGTDALNDRDYVFAYQFIAGGAYALNEAVALTLDYRYMGTERPSVTAAGPTDTGTSYRNNTIMAGLRYAF